MLNSEINNSSMRKMTSWLWMLLIAFVAVSCTTDDVEIPNNGIDPDDLYEITDAAFVDYLIYNCGADAANKLPYGTAFMQDGKRYINKSIAATATLIYLVKDANRITILQNAGIATADDKISSLDGIQFFTNATEIRLTSNGIIGELDLSMLTKLEILEMNSNYVSVLKLPSSIVRLRYAASTSASAPDNRWLTSIDLSACTKLNHIHLPNHRIVTTGLQLPAIYPDLTYINLSGNTDAPFEISEALYNQLTDTDGRLGVMIGSGGTPDPSNLVEIANNLALAEYLMYNATQPYTGTNAVNNLPAGIVVKDGDKYYLDKDIAATVSVVYLVKDATRMGNLASAGVATANDKLVNIDILEHFINATDIKLTSNQIVGTLDVSALTKLEVLEMNSNFVNNLILPASITRLRYSASSSAPAGGKLTAINLSVCTNINHVYLPNHDIATAADFILPTTYTNFTDELNLNGNSGAPFTIPSDLFNQLGTKNGVIEAISGSYDGPLPEANYFEVPELAFAEYLVFLSTITPDAAYKLPAGTAFVHTNGKIYLDKAKASTVEVLFVSKASGYITKLTTGGVATASTKLKGLEGLRFFTSLKELTATSNEFENPLELSTLTELTRLVVRTAGLSALDVSANTKLEYLDIQGSSSSSLGKLSSVNLSTNIKLKYVNLSANRIPEASFTLPTIYPDLTYMNMGNNNVSGSTVIFKIPAALYSQLTSSESGNKSGLQVE